MSKHRLQRLLAVGAVLSVFAAACGSSATEGSGGEGSGAATGVCATVDTTGTDLLAQICASGTIRVSTDPAYPPQSSLNEETGEYEGFDIDVATEIATRLGVEVAWEAAENSPMVINRYREATISLGYFGDSVLNSTSDVLCCLVGFAIASRLPWKASLLAVALIDLGLALTIRDGLLLNILMLIHPIAAVRAWQAAR